MTEPLSRIPAGMRYFSGAEARLRRAIESAIISIFSGWSYEEITTPTVDYYSLFEHGMGASQAHRAFRFSDTDGRLLALRPDVTSLVARAAATLFADRPRPLRLCYVAPVFRQQPQSHAEWRRESSQIGCELIGANSEAADSELLVIVCEVLKQLNLDERCCVTLNNVDVFNGIAEELQLDAGSRDELRELVDSRNTADLERFRHRFISPQQQAAFANLIWLSGDRRQLDEARRLIINPRSRSALDRLARLWSVIESLGLGNCFDIDLGDVSRLDYYTGLTFKIYVAGSGVRVGSGGRYDGLTASFGKPEPAVGFVLELDTLTEVLLACDGDPAAIKESDTDSTPITGADLTALFRTASERRQKGERVVIKAGEVNS